MVLPKNLPTVEKKAEENVQDTRIPNYTSRCRHILVAMRLAREGGKFICKMLLVDNRQKSSVARSVNSFFSLLF